MRSTASYTCDSCGFSLWHPIVPLVVSAVGLYDDDRFPGRALVVLREHHEHWDAVPAELAGRFTNDMLVVGRVLRTTFGADRVNYAVLGNVESHVHAHVIPRYLPTDPIPARPPWEHPAEKGALSGRVLDDIAQRLAAAIEGQARKGVDD